MLRGTVNAVCMCLPETCLEGQDAAWHCECSVHVLPETCLEGQDAARHCECRVHVPTRGQAQTLNKQSSTIDTIYVQTALSTPTSTWKLGRTGNLGSAKGRMADHL